MPSMVAPLQNSNLHLSISNLSEVGLFSVSRWKKRLSFHYIFVCTESSGKLFPFTLFHIHPVGFNTGLQKVSTSTKRSLSHPQFYSSFSHCVRILLTCKAKRAAWKLPLEVSEIWGLTCLGKILSVNICGTSLMLMCVIGSDSKDKNQALKEQGEGHERLGHEK